MKPVIIYVLVILSIIPKFASADTWTDPSIKEMIRESNVIGVFRVIEGGAFKARLIPVRILKGKVSGEIWLGGFSNKYGPIDTLRVGEVYVLFINQLKQYKSRYGSSSNFAKQSIAQAAYEAAAFVRNQKNGYFVPTPTSGEYPVLDDKVFIDLAAVNSRIEGFPLEDLRALINTRSKTELSVFADHCVEQIRKSSIESVYLTTNYLAALELIDGVAYNIMFQALAANSAWQTRFTLAKVLGTVKGNASRELLVRMIVDTVGVVQGEVIRQLKPKLPPGALGPLLVSLIDSASTNGLYPSLMNPVRNEFESGKIQIIETLADIDFKPAIPKLLLLLGSKDDYVFEHTLNALVKLKADGFPKAINNKLSDPGLSASGLFKLTRIIEEKNLVECTDGLFAQLSLHSRNENRDKTMLLSTLVILADGNPAIEKRIIDDFNLFFTYYDTLYSYNQEKWIKGYLDAFTRLNSESARPLVYRALYEWTGLHPNDFITPALFEEKQQKEDSLSNQFSRSLANAGYVLKKVIYFHSSKKGDDFLVSIQLPDDDANFPRRRVIADQMNLNEDRVFLVANAGWYWLERQERFEENGIFNPMANYIKYAEACPSRNDLFFLKSLKASNRWAPTGLDREISLAIGNIENKLAAVKK